MCGSTRRAATLPSLDYWMESNHWIHKVLRFLFKDWLSSSRSRGKAHFNHGSCFGCTVFHNVLSSHHLHGPVLFMQCYSSEMIGVYIESM